MDASPTQSQRSSRTSTTDANNARVISPLRMKNLLSRTYTPKGPTTAVAGVMAPTQVHPAIEQLLQAAHENDTSAINQLLATHASSGLSAASASAMGRTALHAAAFGGALNATQYLLVKSEVDTSPKDVWEKTPLDDAVRMGHKQVEKLLRERGAVLGSPAASAMSVFDAIAKGNVSEIESLIESGAPTDAVDKDGRTYLHHAVSAGNLSAVELLIKQGLDLSTCDSFGLTPLGEAARHSSRTGENKIADLLRSAGAGSNATSDASQKLGRRFVWAMCGFQTFFITCFMAGTRYAAATADAAVSPAALKTTYSMFMDVHVMIFVGFGFLMTFLRKYGHSSVGLNFLVAAFVLQWHLLCGGFFHQVFEGKGHAWHRIDLGLGSLLVADFASATVLITFGALLGKVNPLQLLVLAFFEVVFFSINENVLVQIGLLDVGGSVIVHLFGAYFGLAASWVLSDKAASDNQNNASVYHSDLFAMIGTLFLWVYWPSFVSSPAGATDQERAIVATTLSLTGSCVAAFIASLRLRGGRFSMVDVQNATLAGGVAIGSAANLAVLSPAEALVIGVLSGVLSVVGYTTIQPKLEHHLGLHDTCGVNNLHGMPALLAALASAAVIAYSGDAGSFPTTAAYHGVYGEEPVARTAAQQAGFQLLGMVVSFSFAVVAGLVSGGLVRCIPGPAGDELFDDKQNFEVPGQEVPFYFDERGEINREIFSSISIRGGNAFTSAVTELSAHGGTRFAALAGPSGGGNGPPVKPFDAAVPASPAKDGRGGAGTLISNELLSLKLDLVLQHMGQQMGRAPPPASPAPPPCHLEEKPKQKRGFGDVAMTAVATSVATTSLRGSELSVETPAGTEAV